MQCVIGGWHTFVFFKTEKEEECHNDQVSGNTRRSCPRPLVCNNNEKCKLYRKKFVDAIIGVSLKIVQSIIPGYRIVVVQVHIAYTSAKISSAVG